MLPLAQPPPADLSGVGVLILSGSMDPMVPAAVAARLEQDLASRGARVESRSLPAAHALSQADLSLAAGWLDANARLPEGAPQQERR